jgi:hypothetical protein
MKFRIIILNILLLFLVYSSYATYTKLGDYQSGGNLVSVFVSGDYVYTARFDGLVEIINISHPETPHLVGSIFIPEHIPGVRGRIIVSDTLAFILGQSNIHVVNISNPAEPVYRTAWIYYAKDMIVSGHLAYLTAGSDFIILDISDVQSPEILSSISGGFEGICLNDTVIYCVDHGGSVALWTIDVSNPLAPVYLSNTLDLPAYSNSDIAYSDDHVFIVSGDNVWTIDVHDPANPITVDTMMIKTMTNKICIDNDKAIINDDVSGISVIDISDPGNPVISGYYDTPGYAYQVFAENNIVYIANSYSGLQIVDIANNINPWQLGSVDVLIQSLSQGIDCKDDYAYVNVGNGLEVVDIKDVQDPKYNGYFFDGYGASDNVSTYNNHLCFSLRWEWPRLNFVDISIPGEPVLMYSIDLFGGWSDYYGLIPIDQDDSHVFVGTGDSLRIYDIADFGHPFQVSAFITSASIMDVLVENDRAYISIGEDGIEIIDIENINSPQLLGSFNTSGNAGKLALHSGILIISDGTGGVQFVDVSNPVSPSLTGSVKPHSNSDIIANPVIVGNQMTISDREWNELFTYDISDFSNALLIKSLKINAEIYQFIYYSDVFFCSVNYYGMIILDSSPLLSVDGDKMDPYSACELNIFPNPFNSTTTIEYKLCNKTFVNVEILNQAGMKIKTLANGIEYAGIHYLSWDGTGSNQEKVPSGCYFVKMKGNHNDSRQVLFIQ